MFTELLIIKKRENETVFELEVNSCPHLRRPVDPRLVVGCDEMTASSCLDLA